MIVIPDSSGYFRGATRWHSIFHPATWLKTTDSTLSFSSGNLAENDGFNAVPAPAVAQAEQMSDLKVFWGPEICRLEYLLHLMDTGRIKDEYRQTALQ